MFARQLITGMAPFSSVRSLSLGLLLGLLLGFGLLPEDALAQRPFRLSDPFYRGETARRHFFDNYALTGEVSYRSAGTLQGDGVPASNNDLAFRFRFDYELVKSLDLSFIFDAVGAAGARQLSLSWLVLKYYRYVKETHSDYAFRLAVDPSSNGRMGFPQVDLAFIYTSQFSPVVSTDIAIGMRRVNIGYAEFIPPAALTKGDPFVIRPRPTVIYTRALGTEFHLLLTYNLLFDPARSNLFVDFLGEAGSYDLVEAPLEVNSSLNIADLGSGEAPLQEEAEKKTSYRGGTFWMRFGVEFNRPGYQISPFLGAPLKQWIPETDDDDWPEARLHFGFQLTLR